MGLHFLNLIIGYMLVKDNVYSGGIDVSQKKCINSILNIIL